MKKRGRYIACHTPEKEDRRKKTYRITDSLTGITSQGQFYINFALHGEFVEQYTAYPAVGNDDVIEAVSEATRLAQESLTLEGVWSQYEDEDDTSELLGACP